jgi:hypothetical protein
MTTFRLLRFGQSGLINEFRGNSIMQNGQYLQIINANNEVTASLILEPGYYLADVNALAAASEQVQSSPSVVRSLR